MLTMSLSILKEINPAYSLEGLKLKLQYSGHLMRTEDSLERCLMLGKIEGRRSPTATDAHGAVLSSTGHQENASRKHR